jgi:hypothetical protein
MSMWGGLVKSWFRREPLTKPQRASAVRTVEIASHPNIILIGDFNYNSINCSKSYAATHYLTTISPLISAALVLLKHAPVASSGDSSLISPTKMLSPCVGFIISNIPINAIIGWEQPSLCPSVKWHSRLWLQPAATSRACGYCAACLLARRSGSQGR